MVKTPGRHQLQPIFLSRISQVALLSVLQETQVCRQILIEKALFSMEALIVILTQGFKESSWTD